MQKSKTFSNSPRNIHPEKVSIEIADFATAHANYNFISYYSHSLMGVHSFFSQFGKFVFFLSVQSVFETGTNNFNVFFSYKELYGMET